MVIQRTSQIAADFNGDRKVVAFRGYFIALYQSTAMTVIMSMLMAMFVKNIICIAKQSLSMGCLFHGKYITKGKMKSREESAMT